MLSYFVYSYSYFVYSSFSYKDISSYIKLVISYSVNKYNYIISTY